MSAAELKDLTCAALMIVLSFVLANKQRNDRR